MVLSRYTIVAILSTSYLKCSEGLAAPQKRSGGGFGAKPVVEKNFEVDVSPNVIALQTFVKSFKGADIDNIETGRENGQRGLYAGKKILKDKIICKIPSDCALACGDPEKSASAAAEDDTVVHAGLYFLSQYANPSDNLAWTRTYTTTLPQRADISRTPDFFENDEIDLLEFPRAIKKATERKSLIAKLATENKVSIEDLQYATFIVSSRAIPLAVGGGSADDGDDVMRDDRGQVIAKAKRSYVRVLVPIIDFANHRSEPNAKLTLIDPNKDNAYFALTATRPIAEGKEICIAYGSGADSSVELLLNYGFVPDHNPIDTYMLKKGGDDCITGLDGWTTTLDEDKTLLAMTAPEDENLRKILQFRIKLKEAYAS